MPYRITPATNADLQAIRDLHLDSWRKNYRGVLPDPLFGAPIEAEMAAKWAELCADRRVEVVRGAAGLLGFAAFYPDRDGEVFLDNLHVRPGLKGQGIGAVLMAGVARCAEDRPIWLEVLAENTVTRAVYQRWGGIEGDIFEDRIMGYATPGLVVRWETGRALLARLTEQRSR